MYLALMPAQPRTSPAINGLVHQTPASDPLASGGLSDPLQAAEDEDEMQAAEDEDEMQAAEDEDEMQAKAEGRWASVEPTARQEIGASGFDGAASSLPHLDALQQAFGHHDLSGVQAHVGGAAATANKRLGARAYAKGNRVAFGADPDLHTAAHEAAHVVQQRGGGLQLKDAAGRKGDRYERHADAVADAVLSGKSAETLLDKAP